MLEIKYVRENLSEIQESLVKRGTDADLKTLKDCEEKRRHFLLEIEELRHKRNIASDNIAKIKKAGENADAEVTQMREVASRIKELDKILTENNETFNNILISLPNIPHPSVPTGKDENDNIFIKKAGKPVNFNYTPLNHWDIGENLKILDFERAAKITGSRFPLYMGKGARLERALINFMLDIQTMEHGFTEVLPPFIVNRASMTGTGQLPKFAEDLFKLEDWDYFLIPTAEVPVTNIHRDEILTG